MRTLSVFREAELVGQLREQDEEIEFKYAPAYLFAGSQPISASLPLDPALIQGARVRAFFGNLLPEGEVRTALARQFKLDAGDDIGLLSRLGVDCAGALVILPEGEEPQPEDAPFEQRYAALDDEYEFGQYLDALGASPMAAFKGVPTRMSLAGAQDKTALARFGSPRLYRSLGGATTHIVKLGSRLDARGNELYPSVVFNELFCSQLAQACGIPIRPTEALPYRKFQNGPVEHVFGIERYDRAVDFETRRVTRLHQEDFCQALGRPRTQKYEAEAGVSLAEMFRFVSNPEQIVVPAIARIRLLELVLFNLVIGNRDCHAKNYSLLRIRSDAKAMLAPAYDLVCTEIYENVDRSLPQKIGETGTFDALNRNDLNAFADQIELKRRSLRREVDSMCVRVLAELPAAMGAIGPQPISEQARAAVEKIVATIKTNAEKLQALPR